MLSKGFSGSVSLYGLIFVETLTGFIVTMILVRGLPQTEYGIFKLVGSFVTIGVSVCLLGMDRAFLRYGAELIIRKNLDALFFLLKRMVLIRISALSILVVAIYVSREFLSNIFHITLLQQCDLFLMLLILILTGVNSLWGIAFQHARLDQVQASINLILARVLLLLGYTYVIWMGFGLSGILFVWFFSSFFSTVYFSITNRQWIRQNRRGLTVNLKRFEGLERSFVKRVGRFSSYAYVAQLVNLFKDLTVDNVVIAYYLGPKEVALYSLATVLINFAMSLNPASRLRTVFQPIFVERHTENNSEAPLIRGFQIMIKLTFFTCLPVLAMLTIFGDKIIAFLFSSEYLAAVVPMTWLAFFMLFGSLEYPFITLLNTVEKNQIILVGGIFSVYNLVMNIILIPKLGIQGAAIATGSARLLEFLFFWTATKKFVRLKIRFPWVSFGKTVMNLCPCLVCCWLIKPLINNLIGLLVVCLLSAALYLFCSILNKIFSADERDSINARVGKRLFVF